VRKPMGKWVDAVWRDALYLPQILSVKPLQGREKVGGRRSGRPWPESGPRRH
jgi:hypothetical protein